MNKTQKWGVCSNEKQFNNWLKGRGAKLLMREIRTLLGRDYKRIRTKNRLFGFPDHCYYSSAIKQLLIVESADILTKRHLSKDIMYLAEQINDLEIYSKAIFWVLRIPPSKDIVEKIRSIHNAFIINSYPVYYYLSELVSATGTALRLNLDVSYGERISRFNNRSLPVYCNGAESRLSIKSFADALGLPYSTAFNVISRFGIKKTANMVALSSIKTLIATIEQKSSREAGVDLRNRFVPAHLITDQMLFAGEVNRRLGYKGGAVRIPVKPRFITISGSGPKGYRLLYDITDLKAYKENREKRGNEHL
ncbi:MAG: hypothetical protein JW925_12380 [Syntrophaceae bacterium]|nr:hypothetical protein [Syntrophaceae bacterium]